MVVQRRIGGRRLGMRSMALRYLRTTHGSEHTDKLLGFLDRIQNEPVVMSTLQFEAMTCVWVHQHIVVFDRSCRTVLAILPFSLEGIV